MFFFLSVGFLFAANAQNNLRRQIEERVEQRVGWVDSVVTSRYYRVKYDTAYIGRPEGKVTLKLRTNISGSTFRFERNDGVLSGKSRLHTQTRGTISVGASYRGISASISLNPAKLGGKSKDNEYALNVFKNRFGLDINYQDTKTMSGSVTHDGIDYEMGAGSVDFRMFNVNAYYVFNGKRFSYPAAFTQSYIQKRSAGSWLIGVTYLGGRIKTIGETLEGVGTLRIREGYLSIGGGYAYNFVYKKRWLFHLSVLPTLVVGSWNDVRLDDQRTKMKTHFPHINTTTRAAINYQFNKKYFAGATLMMNNSLMGNRSVFVDYTRWYVRLIFGIRL